MFRNREEAAHELARAMETHSLRDPIVLAIPRGGVVTGATLAHDLGADLDIVLSRKLRAPYQPELAIGAVCENGQTYLDPAFDVPELAEYVEQERQYQVAEIARRKRLFRAVRPAASLTGRSVIVTDDGIATGATMIAALKVARAKKPYRLIVAAPVAPPERLKEVGRHCDEVVCLLAPERFHAVGQFYEDFRQVEDEEVLELLRLFGQTGKNEREPASA